MNIFRYFSLVLIFMHTCLIGNMIYMYMYIHSFYEYTTEIIHVYENIYIYIKCITNNAFMVRGRLSHRLT